MLDLMIGTESTENLHGHQRYETKLDFSSKKDLKDFIKSEFKKISCLKCGGRKLSYKNHIIVFIKKVVFFKQEKKVGLLGREKLVDTPYKTAWRIDNCNVGRGFEVTCKSCKNKTSDFPTTEFLCLPLLSAQDMCILFDNISGNDKRNDFIRKYLVDEAMQQPVKMKFMLLAYAKRIEERASSIEKRISNRPSNADNNYDGVTSSSRSLLRKDQSKLSQLHLLSLNINSEERKRIEKACEYGF